MGTTAACPKPRASKRYHALVYGVRGFLRTEIRLILNRLVAQGRPTELALERLDFGNPVLSRRLNAILRNCGRSIIKTKLQDLADRFGVTVTDIPARLAPAAAMPTSVIAAATSP